jgi:DNA invertase Pin-like site-specific DNA recombinase
MRTNARRPSRVGPLAERREVTNETIWGRFCDDPSTFDLFAIVKQIVDAKAQFQSLAEPWADTGTSTGRLMLAVLGGLADVERDLIRTRSAEGRSRAKAQGQQMGRPPAPYYTRRNRKRPSDAARGALRSTNSPAATT